jgi:hypothetical protein
VAIDEGSVPSVDRVARGVPAEQVVHHGLEDRAYGVPSIPSTDTHEDHRLLRGSDFLQRRLIDLNQQGDILGVNERETEQNKQKEERVLHSVRMVKNV